MRGTAALTTATNRVEAERNVSQRSRGRQDKLNAQTGLTKTMTCSARRGGGRFVVGVSIGAVVDGGMELVAVVLCSSAIHRGARRRFFLGLCDTSLLHCDAGGRIQSEASVRRSAFQWECDCRERREVGFRPTELASSAAVRTSSRSQAQGRTQAGRRHAHVTSGQAGFCFQGRRIRRIVKRSTKNEKV